MNNWNVAKPTMCAKWLVLPTVYSDTLSYGEQLDKFCYQLNELIKNNNILPEYIADMIEKYISSGAIGEVVRDILANYILNVKYPPEGITPAVGDGSADDTTAIQGCIDYASANGGVVYFPYGTYLTQPLTMKDGVSLFGFDRYSTKLVLKGGANNALIGGNAKDFSIANLTLDGNSGIQVNEVNVVSLESSNVLFTNLIIKDGYTLVNYYGTDGHFQLSNIIFGDSVRHCLVTSGEAEVQAENILFNHLSVNGVSVIDISTDGGFYNFKSVATCNHCIVVNGNDNKISAIVENATTPFIDLGFRNNIEIFGVTNKEFYSGNTTKEVNGSYSKHIGGTYTKAVGGNASESVDGNFTSIVTGESTETFQGNRTVTENNKTINTNGDKTETVTGNVTENYNASKTETVTGDVTENYNASKTETVARKVTENYNGGAVENVTGNKEINATDITLNPTNPLGYKEPQNLNEYFKFVQFKNGDNIYDVLVRTDKTDELNHSPFVNVQDFGAVGDGVTDDSVAFQSAIDTGFDVFVPASKGQVYLVKETLSINKVRQVIFGECDTRSMENDAKVGFIDFDVTPGFSISQMNVHLQSLSMRNHNAKPTAPVGVCVDVDATQISDNGDLYINNCFLYGFLTGINHKGRGIECIDNRFIECNTAISVSYDFDGSGGTPLQQPDTGFRAVRVVNNRFHGVRTILNVEKGHLVGCLVANNVSDIGSTLFESKATAKISYCVISNNVDNFSFNIPITFYGDVDHTIIAGNSFCNLSDRLANFCIHAVYNDSGEQYDFSNNVIANNEIYNFKQDGFLINRPINNCLIEGNIFNNIGLTSNKNCIRCRGINNSIIANNIFDPNSNGVYGVMASNAEINNSVIEGNTCSAAGILKNYVLGVSSKIQDLKMSSAPSTGTWKVGDIVYNSNPTDFIGWVCTVAGTPGTWKTFGAVSQ